MSAPKNIMLTGGGGMVGMNILNHSLSKKWEILSPSSQELDLTNFDATISYISTAKPDIVIHAAGHVGGIHANILQPVNFLVDNLDIGRNVIMASYKAGVKRLINLGSSCMYPKDATNPLTEDQILSGELELTNEGYALAKIVAARLCEYIYRENPKFEYKTMIPCNIYGSFDKFDPIRSHLIPAIINKVYYAIENKDATVEIWGDGKSKREFMYAEDLADVIFYALDNFDTMPPILNIGAGVDHTIDEYYSVVSEVMGFSGKFFYNLDKPTGMMQKLVSTKKQADWGWGPKIGLYEGVSKTYDYYLRTIN